GVEVRRFEEDGGGPLPYLGVETTHDAGDRDGLLRVGDDQHVIGQLTVDAVDGTDALARPGAADDYAAAAELAQIEGMQGLAHLQHDVVRYVDNVVDRTHAGGGEALLHPVRGRTDLHPLDDAGEVARAEVGVFDGHGRLLR